MALHGGSGLLEHPKDSEDDNAVSIWRLPALRLIIQLPGMRQVHVAQGLFGAQSPKPTNLLSLGVATSNIGKRPSLWYVDYDASAQRFSRPR